MLKALSKDFCFTYSQIEEFARDQCIFSYVFNNLLPCLVGGTTARYLTFMLTPTLGEFIWNMVTCSQLLAFNVENPTGHYRPMTCCVSDWVSQAECTLLERGERMGAAGFKWQAGLF